MKTFWIIKSDVPAYLRNGEFFTSLSDDEDHDQQISIPSNTLKADTTVLNNADLHHLLTSLRFWGVSSVRDEVIKYCLSELEFPCDDILQEFVQDFSYVSTLMSVLSANKDEEMMVAVQAGILEIVRNLPRNLMVTIDSCSAAAGAGNLEILQCLHERGGVLNSAVLQTALEGGDNSLACVQYLRAQGVEWPPLALYVALKAGSKECFHHALQDGCTWGLEGVVITFCEDKYAETLKYALNYEFPVHNYSTALAAAKGAIKCLQVLHEVNCPWDEDSCSGAAAYGHLDCLQYLHENGCPWDEETVHWAVKRNHVECVQYALQLGCPIHINCCYFAAQNGCSPILQMLHEHGCPWDKGTCSIAGSKGHVTCLQYAHEHGCPWDEITFRSTLESGQLECLKYLLENGCPMNMKGCQELIAQGKCSPEAVGLVRSFYPHLL